MSIIKDKAKKIEFWARFNEILIERGKPFNVRKPTTDHWYDIVIGTSDAHVSFTIVNREHAVGVELYVPDNKELFEKKEEIDEKLGFHPDWQRLDGKKAARILYRMPGLDFEDHSNYDSLMNEMIDKATLFAKVFKKYV